VDISTIENMDAVVLAVAHTEFKNLSMSDMNALYGDGKKVLIDVKGLLNRKEYEAAGYSYWRL
jgi:UDP-N-acetyl-D-galactosamine dehydrogenase